MKGSRLSCSSVVPQILHCHPLPPLVQVLKDKADQSMLSLWDRAECSSLGLSPPHVPVPLCPTPLEMPRNRTPRHCSSSSKLFLLP